ncbi:lycopene cyclase family protein [Saccharothrix mutabilis subsp. mutabilis]|uniref:Lycopene cyclase family protein n=1 Tax=Saccharothrix mutabilis subsp. mutabilis TaxID=66855 RepID=A0ABN0UUY3_9PSEU
MTGLVIAGGGLSGLSLAAHLAPLPVTVVDDGRRDVAALSWASWADRPGLLDAAVSRRFDRVRVHVGGRTRVLGLGRYRYQVVRGADLLRVVRERVPGCSFVRGHVTEVGAGRVVVDGRELAARWVFDSVAEPPPAQALLSFHGWHVRSERPVFDAAVPTLFDFRTAQLGGASFVYVLPVDAHRALVEHTSFTRSAVDSADAVREYLEDVLGAGDFVVERTEKAVLPLSAREPVRRRGSVLEIGTPGGLVKASTGYAYQRVQRDSAAIAVSLRRHGHPFDLPVPPGRFRLYDAVLLDVVGREPARLEQAFTALFRHGTAEPALRFLDERTSPAQEARLFSAMPAGVYLAALRRRVSGSR